LMFCEKEIFFQFVLEFVLIGKEVAFRPIKRMQV